MKCLNNLTAAGIHRRRDHAEDDRHRARAAGGGGRVAAPGDHPVAAAGGTLSPGCRWPAVGPGR